MSYSTTLSGSTRSRSSSTGVSSRALAAAAKAEQAEELLKALDVILQLHRPEFPPARPLVAPAPPAPDLPALLEKHRRAALQGVSVFNRQARAQAKIAAEHAAHAEAAAITANDQRLHAGYQTHLDGIWAGLLRNDPETVLGVLAEAFEDNEAAAAPVGVAGDEASLVVLVPAESAVPERRPTTTAAGNLSLKKLTKREVAELYRQMVAGYVLVTVKEAFAVAPHIQHIRIVALRSSGADAYGNPRLEAVEAARFTRGDLDGVRWETSDAETVLVDISTEMTVRLTGPSKNLTALDLKAEPDVAAVISAVDVGELISEQATRA